MTEQSQYVMKWCIHADDPAPQQRQVQTAFTLGSSLHNSHTIGIIQARVNVQPGLAVDLRISKRCCIVGKTQMLYACCVV